MTTAEETIKQIIDVPETSTQPKNFDVFIAHKSEISQKYSLFPLTAPQRLTEKQMSVIGELSNNVIFEGLKSQEVIDIFVNLLQTELQFQSRNADEPEEGDKIE